MTLLATQATVDKYEYGPEGRYMKLLLRLTSSQGSPERTFFDLYDNGDKVYVIVSEEPTDWERAIMAVQVIYRALKKVPEEVRKEINMNPEDIALIKAFLLQEKPPKPEVVSA